MDNRCANCNKLLMAMTDRTGHTELRCLKCDKVDPMKTDAVKWADSPIGECRLELLMRFCILVVGCVAHLES
jgi:phage FluMu protein Com